MKGIQEEQFNELNQQSNNSVEEAEDGSIPNEREREFENDNTSMAEILKQINDQRDSLRLPKA